MIDEDRWHPTNRDTPSYEEEVWLLYEREGQQSIIKAWWLDDWYMDSDGMEAFEGGLMRPIEKMSSKLKFIAWTGLEEEPKIPLRFAN